MYSKIRITLNQRQNGTTSDEGLACQSAVGENLIQI